MWPFKLLVKIAAYYFPALKKVLLIFGVYGKGQELRPDVIFQRIDNHRNVFGEYSDLSDANLCEIGFGDSVINGVLFFLLGAERSVLIDVCDAKNTDLDWYKNMIRRLSESYLNFVPSRLANFYEISSYEGMVNLCNIRVFTDGIGSFYRTGLAEEFDLIFSHSCLEHIPLRELPSLFRLHERCLRIDGFFSHNIDLQDHLTGGVVHLLIPSFFWESRLGRNAGFYVNRKLFSDWVKFFNNGRLSVSFIDSGRRNPGFSVWAARFLNLSIYRGSDLVIPTMHVGGALRK